MVTTIMNTVNRVPSKVTRRLSPISVVELVGPTCSGKTTVTRALAQCTPQVEVAADIAMRRIEHLGMFVRSAPALLPTLLTRDRNSRWFTWEEIKSIMYVEAWPRVLEKQAANNDGVILLDQGPVFRLALLHAFGPAILGKLPADKWWNRMFKQWASYLDLIIWLDAPNPVLQRRINARDRWHIVKGKSEQEVSQFLDRYRVSYRHVLQQLSSNGGPKIIPFDTSQVSLKEVERTVLDACDVISP